MNMKTKLRLPDSVEPPDHDDGDTQHPGGPKP
jgi:hypothetical protein